MFQSTDAISARDGTNRQTSEPEILCQRDFSGIEIETEEGTEIGGTSLGHFHPFPWTSTSDLDQKNTLENGQQKRFPEPR